MTLTIELTPEEETRLQEEAQRAGVAPSDYVRRLIDEDLAVLPDNPTGAQLLKYWEDAGLLGLYADRPDTETFARELRANAWQGREIPPASQSSTPASADPDIDMSQGAYQVRDIRAGKVIGGARIEIPEDAVQRSAETRPRRNKP